MDTENMKDQYQESKSVEIYVTDLPGADFVAGQVIRGQL